MRVSIGYELREAQRWQIDPLTEVDDEGVAAEELAHKKRLVLGATGPLYPTPSTSCPTTVSILRRFCLGERGQGSFSSCFLASL